MVPSHPWWCPLAGGESGGDEVFPRGLLCYDSSGIADMVFSGEILVVSSVTDTVPSSVVSFLPEGHLGYPSVASLCAGETLVLLC